MAFKYILLGALVVLKCWCLVPSKAFTIPLDKELEGACGVVTGLYSVPLEEDETFDQKDLEDYDLNSGIDYEKSFVKSGCQIAVCGQLDPTAELVMDCFIFTGGSFAVPASFEDFHYKSVSCTCSSVALSLTNSCSDKKAQVQNLFKKEECAYLYNDQFCNDYDFPVQTLKEAQTVLISNDFFRSIIVRDKCQVFHYISPLDMEQERDFSIYSSDSTVVQSGPPNSEAIFICKCEGDINFAMAAANAKVLHHSNPKVNRMRMDSKFAEDALFTIVTLLIFLLIAFIVNLFERF